ncbi:MAG: hypothetical protein BGO43_15750 [Gammaproteobacteria bacterium 39-13]|nr:phytanoyl-CoA dioxygenase family protein [Gammaproteobacteria bacterium]OJV87862.1 MAG: hypothetical protein BGO43_15750 [Gammaproteobacteria bacterium 39-13]
MRNQIIKILRQIKQTALDVPKLLWGFLVYSFKKKTPKSAHQSLINLFCLTGGYSNDILSLPISMLHRPYKIHSAKGVLGDFNREQLKDISKRINEEGFYIFENKLPDELCEKLLKFAYTHPATIRGDTIQYASKEIYVPHEPKAVRYDYEQQMLIDNAQVQNLITDKSIIAVAQNYLRAKPVLDVIGMWWHTAYQKEPDSSAAQFFHFDMDRIRWLKFFIYLTDVNDESGPHAFVKSSHKNKGIPRHLRARGYARIKDEEIFSIYDKENVIYHIAPKGTIIAEDTRGLHKGQHVVRGDRLVLQLQFSNHLFGADYPSCKFKNKSEKLVELIAAYPRLYSNYV